MAEIINKRTPDHGVVSLAAFSLGEQVGEVRAGISLDFFKDWFHLI